MSSNTRASAARDDVTTAPHTTDVEVAELAALDHGDPAYRPLEVQACAWLLRAASAVNAAQAEALRDAGLSPSAFAVLVALETSPEPLEPWEIAERLLVSRPSVTGLLDTLERRDLLARQRHGTDGRRVLVQVTPAGRDLLAEHLPARHSAQRTVLADLSADELAHLVTLLRRVRGATPAHHPAERRGPLESP